MNLTLDKKQLNDQHVYQIANYIRDSFNITRNELPCLTEFIIGMRIFINRQSEHSVVLLEYCQDSNRLGFILYGETYDFDLGIP